MIGIFKQLYDNPYKVALHEIWKKNMLYCEIRSIFNAIWCHRLDYELLTVRFEVFLKTVFNQLKKVFYIHYGYRK